MSIRTRRNSKRLLAGVLAGAFALSGVAVSSSVAADDVTSNSGTFDPDVTVVDGQNRYETAAIVADLDDIFTDGVDVVILANGQSFPDGLAASGLVGGLSAGPLGLNAAILLTEANSLPAATAQAIEDIAPGLVIAIGGTAAISDAVLTQVQTILDAVTPAPLDDLVVRIGGADRYETAEMITEIWVALAQDNVAAPISEVILATGENFPDALAAGALAVNGTAALNSGPGAILLTRGNTLPASTLQAIQAIGNPPITIVGGTAAVPAAIATQLTALGLPSTRISGANRYETAQQIAAVVNPDPETYVLVSGENFPDALSAAPATFNGPTLRGNPILLTQTASLTPSTQAWIGYNAGSVTGIFVIGGSAAVSNAAVLAARNAAVARPPAFQAAAPGLPAVAGFYTNASAALITATASANSRVTFSANTSLGLEANNWVISIVSASAQSVNVNNSTRTITVNVTPPLAGASGFSSVSAQTIRTLWNASPAVRLFSMPTGNLTAVGVTVAAASATARINQHLAATTTPAIPRPGGPAVADLGVYPGAAASSVGALIIATLNTKCASIAQAVGSTVSNSALNGPNGIVLGGAGGGSIPADATACVDNTTGAVSADLPFAPLLIWDPAFVAPIPAVLSSTNLAAVQSLGYNTLRVPLGSVVAAESGLSNPADLTSSVMWLPISLLG